MAVAILVADQAASTGLAFEHRQQIGPARLGSAWGPPAAGGPDLGDRVPGRDVDHRRPVGGTAVAESADVQRRGQDAAHGEERQAEPGRDLPVREALQGQAEGTLGRPRSALDRSR